MAEEIQIVARTDFNDVVRTERKVSSFFDKSNIDRAPGELDQLESAAERLLDFPSQVEKLIYVVRYEDDEGVYADTYASKRRFFHDDYKKVWNDNLVSLPTK